jgi:SAM-dependent methyltransferase
MSPNETFQYVGRELDIFQHARNWKAYFSRFFRPYVRGEVLEVGAGIGANTQLLFQPPVSHWTCLEPDQQLTNQLRETLQSSSLPGLISIVVGTLQELDEAVRFDAIMYIDVLEHIENDLAEVHVAARKLKAGGHLLVLSPAHPFLFSPFDQAIGHFRRYTRRMLLRLNPPGCSLVKAFYLDSCGLLASLANRYLLRSKMPTLKQVYFWDRVLVTNSRWLDFLSAYKLGKSIIGIWKKNGVC